MIYSFESRVRYSELDCQGRMNLPSLINYFQDCSTFQSEEIGLGVEVLKNRRKAWFLSYWQVVVERFPGLGEKIRVGTMATKFKGLYGNRNFFMQDESGRQVACANSVWVFMDLDKGRPARPGEEDIAPYGVEPPLVMEYEDRKIRLPESTQSLPSFPVRRRHIDTNGHVNNCQYVQMALEVLPDELSVRQLRVDYKKSAVFGSRIYPKVSAEPGRTVAELCDENGAPYAVTEFRG